jgi:hypothetical protein
MRLQVIRRKACVECGRHYTKPARKTRREWDARTCCSRDCARRRPKPNVAAALRGRRGSVTGGWKGNAAGYDAAHYRLVVERGFAKAYVCECGEPAQEWALNKDRAGDHLREGMTARYPTPLPYSLVVDDYDPLCRSCHRTRDPRKKAEG